MRTQGKPGNVRSNAIGRRRLLTAGRGV